MPCLSRIHHELASLHAELNTPQHDTPRAGPPTAQDEAESKVAGAADAFLAGEIDEQWAELGKALSQYTGNIEEVMAEHPLASVLGAFVLGLALGRMTGRA